MFDADYNSVRGLLDSTNKVYCAYLAVSFLKIDAGIVSSFFRMNVEYMKNKFEDVVITKTLHPELEKQMFELGRIWHLKIKDE